MTAVAANWRQNGGAKGTLWLVSVCAGLVGIVLFLTIRLPSPSLLYTAALAAMMGVAIWMFLSENYALTLGVLLLYLGLLDGFLKLSTGHELATLGRDVLLYAIVFGALARFAIRRLPIKLPPLSGWVLAFTFVVLVGVFNPGSYPIVNHAIPSVRPHLEFVPLFLFGFHVMRTRKRLRLMLVLLLACGAINGVVNMVQYNLTKDQLASWGPGYDEFLRGGNEGVAGRTFATDEGDRVRPFGLGGDAGGGGLIAILAIPGALALITMAWRRPRYAALAVALGAGAVTAVVSSQGRGVVVAAFVMLLAYAGLVVSPRRLIPTLVGIAVGGLVTMFVVSAVGNSSSQGNAFSRYESIAPSKLFETTGKDRGGALTVVPSYIAKYPLGYGLGIGGPATGFGGGKRAKLSAESEFSFLVLEVGVIGLIIGVGFTLRLLAIAVTRIRRIRDHELQLLLAAIVAPLFGIAALFVGGAPTAGSPLGPYYWFVAGVMSYWLMGRRPPARWMPATGRRAVGAPD